MRVMVTKTAGPIKTRKWLRTSSPISDCVGELIGLIEYLRDSDHEVCVFAQISRGDTIPGVECIVPNVKDIDGLSTVAQVTEVYNEAVGRLRKFDPQICLDFSGSPQMEVSWIDNPWGVMMMDAAGRYSGPALYAIHQLGVPRILMNNDANCYPGEHEMLIWPEVIPVVVLSNEVKTFSRRIRGHAVKVQTTYCPIGNWCCYGVPNHRLDNDRPLDMTVIAHSFTGKRSRAGGCDEAWSKLLDDFDFDWACYGRDWETFSGYRPDHMPGCLKPWEVHHVLGRSKCGPMLTSADGWISGKVREYVVNGAMAIPYGRGELLSWDREGRFYPLDGELRVSDAAELDAVVKRAITDEPWRRAAVEDFRRRTAPDFSVLEHAMHHPEDFAKGYEVCGL